jgi:hypothetical protein
MLVADLYELDGSRPASAIFRDRVSEIESDDPRLDEVRALFERVDAVEDRVRKGDLDSVLQAARWARQISDTIRHFGRESLSEVR